MPFSCAAILAAELSGMHDQHHRVAFTLRSSPFFLQLALRKARHCCIWQRNTPTWSCLPGCLHLLPSTHSHWECRATEPDRRRWIMPSRTNGGRYTSCLAMPSGLNNDWLPLPATPPWPKQLIAGVEGSYVCPHLFNECMTSTICAGHE